MLDDLSPFLPLSPATLYILLALAEEDRHGYGIMKEVDRQSEGRYRLGPGTLYDNLQKLLDHAIVDEVQPPSAGGDSRRRYYRLSSFGRRVLSAEVSRLEGLVRRAKVHLKPRKA
jgi:DNA-binding PadR family transcriptional regulator